MAPSFFVPSGTQLEASVADPMRVAIAPRRHPRTPARDRRHALRSVRARLCTGGRTSSARPAGDDRHAARGASERDPLGGGVCHQFEEIGEIPGEIGHALAPPAATPRPSLVAGAEASLMNVAARRRLATRDDGFRGLGGGSLRWAVWVGATMGGCSGSSWVTCRVVPTNSAI